MMATVPDRSGTGKSEGECVFLSLKDRADQILAVKNVLILNRLNESKVRVLILCYIPG